MIESARGGPNLNNPIEELKVVIITIATETVTHIYAKCMLC